MGVGVQRTSLQKFTPRLKDLRLQSWSQEIEFFKLDSLVQEDFKKNQADATRIECLRLIRDCLQSPGIIQGEVVDKVVVLFNHINNTNENERDESDRSFYETLKDEFLNICRNRSLSLSASQKLADDSFLRSNHDHPGIPGRLDFSDEESPISSDNLTSKVNCHLKEISPVAYGGDEKVLAIVPLMIGIVAKVFLFFKGVFDYVHISYIIMSFLFCAIVFSGLDLSFGRFSLTVFFRDVPPS
ncbi:unnamed protein product [Enterobius vermicularis]|uniref:Uncharacterized protein n=1 Tax=Enterobius vermicularis TaxID=51028 RepID=A0A0N4UX75_ENTVE|nr:unnamed protein product [Enterobius vermicularis]